MDALVTDRASHRETPILASGLEPLAIRAVWIAPVVILMALTIVATEPTSGTVVDPDASWTVSLPSQWQAGLVSGRDFDYTYGPASQLIAALAVRFHFAEDPLSSVPLVRIAFKLVGVLLLGGLFLMMDGLDGPRSVIGISLIWLARVPLDYPSFRPLAVLAVAGFTAHAVSAPSRNARFVWAVTAGAMAFFSQLLTGELLVYAVLGTMALIAVEATIRLAAVRGAGPPGRARPLGEIASVAVVFVVSLALFNLILDLGFLLSAKAPYRPFSSLVALSQSIRGYAATMSIRWSLEPARTIGLAMLIAWTMAVIVWWRLRNPDTGSRVLMSWGITAGLLLKSSLVRSDLGHIVLGLAPWVVVVVTTHLFVARSSRSSLVAFLTFGCFFTVWPTTDLGAWREGLGVLGGSKHPVANFEHLRWFRVDPAAIAPRELIWRGPGVGPPAAVVPYQNQVVVAARRPLVAPILQAYAAHSAAQQRRWVDRLALAGRDLQVVWGLDDIASIRLDNVQTTARLPVIFEHLATEYRDSGSVPASTGYVLLERRDQPVVMRRAPVDLSRTGAEPIGGTYAAATPQTCGLVEVTVEAEFPGLARALQPAEIWLRLLEGEDEVVATRIVPINGRDPWQTIVSVAPPQTIGTVFNDSVTSQSWDAMSVSVVAGRFSVLPTSLEVLAVSCLEIGDGDPGAQGVADDQ